jgi:hypothetical protein
LTKAYTEERPASSINGAGKIGFLYKRKKLYPCLSPVIKINSKWNAK